MEHKLVMVINEMAEVLNISQLKRLQEVMLKHGSVKFFSQIYLPSV